MNYHNKSAQLVHVGTWEKDESPDMDWHGYTWLENNTVEFVYSSEVKPLQLMPPPWPPPSPPPSPAPVADSVNIVLTVVLAVFGSTVICAFAAVVLKRKCKRSFMRIRHVLQLPRLWLGRYLAPRRQQFSSAQRAAVAIFWHLGGWTLADVRTLRVLEVVQVTFAQVMVWNHSTGTPDDTRPYFALLYSVLAIGGFLLTHSAFTNVRTAELCVSGLLYLIIGLLPVISAWIDNEGSLLPQSPSPSSPPPQPPAPPARHIFGPGVQRALMSVSIFLSVSWMLVAYIATREFAWRRRARQAMHSAGSQDRIIQCHRIVT
eukprot:7387884-Prymnesium_polylepis.1